MGAVEGAVTGVLRELDTETDSGFQLVRQRGVAHVRVGLQPIQDVGEGAADAVIRLGDGEGEMQTMDEKPQGGAHGVDKSFHRRNADEVEC